MRGPFWAYLSGQRLARGPFWAYLRGHSLARGPFWGYVKNHSLAQDLFVDLFSQILSIWPTLSLFWQISGKRSLFRDLFRGLGGPVWAFLGVSVGLETHFEGI